MKGKVKLGHAFHVYGTTYIVCDLKYCGHNNYNRYPQQDLRNCTHFYLLVHLVRIAELLELQINRFSKFRHICILKTLKDATCK